MADGSVVFYNPGPLPDEIEYSQQPAYQPIGIVMLQEEGELSGHLDDRGNPPNQIKLNDMKQVFGEIGKKLGIALGYSLCAIVQGANRFHTACAVPEDEMG